MYSLCLLSSSISKSSILKSTDCSTQNSWKCFWGLPLFETIYDICSYRTSVGGRTCWNCCYCFCSDNFGRKLTVILGLSASLAGCLVTIFAGSLLMAEMGNFFLGFGIQGLFGPMICILQEVLDNERRQKGQVLIQSFFSVGAIIIVGLLYFFKDWKVVYIYFLLIPLMGCLLTAIFYFRETPQFMIKLYSVERIREELRFIARQNGKERQFEQSELTSENIIS